MKYSEIVNTESNQMNAEKVDKFLEDHGLQLEWLNNLIINYSEFND
jgi:3,4-dihydroxy-2-butanone 4-phosphate synthase